MTAGFSQDDEGAPDAPSFFVSWGRARALVRKAVASCAQQPRFVRTTAVLLPNKKGMPLPGFITI